MNANRWFLVLHFVFYMAQLGLILSTLRSSGIWNTYQEIYARFLNSGVPTLAVAVLLKIVTDEEVARLQELQKEEEEPTSALLNAAAQTVDVKKVKSKRRSRKSKSSRKGKHRKGRSRSSRRRRARRDEDDADAACACCRPRGCCRCLLACCSRDGLGSFEVLFYLGLALLLPPVVTHVVPMAVVYVWVFVVAYIAARVVGAVIEGLADLAEYRRPEPDADGEGDADGDGDGEGEGDEPDEPEDVEWDAADTGAGDAAPEAETETEAEAEAEPVPGAGVGEWVKAFLGKPIVYFAMVLVLQSSFNWGVHFYSGENYFAVLSHEWQLRNTRCYFDHLLTNIHQLTAFLGLF